MSRENKKQDEIGYWSEIKLEIIEKYATAYSRILAKRSQFEYFYIDAFSGSGHHISRESKETVIGSPLRALKVEPAFKGYFFIDLDGNKMDLLRERVGENKRVQMFQEDCNEVLKESVLPKIQYKNYKRALCLLDPYGIHLKWDIMEAIGKSKAIDMFLNFSIMDINMNAALKNPDDAKKKEIRRVDDFWGNEEWKIAAYRPVPNLFNHDWVEKTDNSAIARAFQKRLKEAAGFEYVPDPLPMKNTRGAIVYYLFFASHNETGARIARSIFKKYKR